MTRGQGGRKGGKRQADSFVLQEHIEKGQFYFLSGKYDHAVEEFEKALSITPENSEILYSLGVAYESANRIGEARDSYLLALKYSPGHTRAKHHLDKLLEK